jgi:protein TonB
LVHGLLAVLVIFGIGHADSVIEVARPLAVRMVEAVHPEEKKIQPPAPKVVPRQPQKVQPLPVLASQTQSATSTFVVPAQPPAPAVLPAPAPAPVAVAAAELLVEARFDADYLSNPKPPYPRASRQLAETGTVYLRVHVGPEGQALKVELKRSSGFPRLDQSALDTVALWRFVPAKRGTIQVASWVVVPVVFSLS